MKNPKSAHFAVKFKNPKISILTIATLLILSIQCSKESDPALAGAGGCTLTFQGKSYKLDFADCNTDNQVTATSSSSVTFTSGPILILEFLQDYVLFNPDVADNDTNYSSLFGSGSATVSVADGKWTFSGTLEDLNGNSESINGTCTCATK